MKRLTKNTLKTATPYILKGRYSNDAENFAINKDLREKVVYKLGQLEDIESDYKISLIDLIRATEGFFYIYNGEVVFTDCPEGILIDFKKRLFIYDNTKFYFKDYNKTWSSSYDALLSKEK